MRRILFLAHAEVLHVVRDRATLAQVLVAADCPAAGPVERRDLRRSATRRPTSSTSIGRARRAAWSTASPRPATSASSDDRRRSTRGRRRAAARRRDAGPDDSARLRSVARARGHCAGPAAVNAEKGSAAGIVQSYAAAILAAYAAELGEIPAAGTANVRATIGDQRPCGQPDRRSPAQPLQPDAATTSTTWCRDPGRAGDADRHAADARRTSRARRSWARSSS